MFRREDRSGIPFHDDNKYAKSPFSVHSKAQPRLRLRKRHAVMVLCVFAAAYLLLKSPSASVSFRSGSSSHAPAPKGGRVAAEQGQAKEKFVVPIPPPVIPPRKEDGNADTSGNSNSNSNNKAATKKQEDKKKKKKKKAPPTLFEFDDKDEKPLFQDAIRSGKKKSKAQDPAPPPPPPPPVAPIVPEAPAPKQQHNWQEIEDDRTEGKKEDTAADVGSETDNVDDDTTGGRRLPSYGHDQTSTGNNGNSNSGAYAKDAPIWEERKNRVKEAFVHSWAAYRRDAWGKDEYHPISKYGSNMIRKGQGFTIVDSLDTILLMGLEEEFEEAKAWVKNDLDFDQDGEVNLFETTIRVLGGLLSAYDQSGQDPVFLHKAVDLADRLMGAFETTSGIPYASVHLKDRRGVPSHDRGISSTSEVATLQLEFKYLSHLTGDAKYWKAAENVILKMKDLDNLDGLVPIYINPYTGNFQGGEIRLGSRGDSYYEYLIKQYLQTGKTEKIYKDMYDHAMGGAKKHLLGRTIPNNLLFVGEISKYEPQNLSPKMDHLVCFLGGTMALGSTEGRSLNDGGQTPRKRLSIVQEEDFRIGEELTESCYEMYHQTETGLAPEIVYWVQKEEQIRGKSALQHTPGSDFIINDRDGHNWLRPETVESLFYLWRLTGNDKYRHWGWNIFEAIEKYSKVSTGGYSSIHDIRRADNVRFSDKMETFFLAETLKYFYLLFGSDEVLPLDKYVFNTEAHPLPIFTPSNELLARTSSYRSSSSSDASPNDNNDKDEESAEEKRYKDLISKEDDQEAVADDDDNENEVEPSADEDEHTMEDEEDEVVGTDDSLTAEDTENTPKGSLEDEDEEGDEDADEVDQGLGDLALDTGEDEEAEVPEVEVDYEDSANDGEAEEDAEEEGEDGEDGEDGGDGELGSEMDVEEEDDEGEEPDEEDEEEEEDDFSVDNVGDDFGVVNPKDWEDKDSEEEEEKEEEQPSYNDHGLL
ncbi:mannosyl-oligosaccharide alpha-1,2-mannosidase [Mortierella alpina]|nr:mannosyl-oligosaccharide alpha-1,2-mannosidase [Mortierella alpina]